MAIAVALGAFGTHALKGSFDERQLSWWATAQQYHVWHALGLILACTILQETQKWHKDSSPEESSFLVEAFI